MKSRCTHVFWLCCLALVAGSMACGDNLPMPSPQFPPASIAITPSGTININRGSWVVVTVLEKDAAGNLIVVASPSALAFTSRNPVIASVDSTGRITAVAPGSTRVVVALRNTALADSVAVDVFFSVARSSH